VVALALGAGEVVLVVEECATEPEALPDDLDWDAVDDDEADPIPDEPVAYRAWRHFSALGRWLWSFQRRDTL
jgi:hypothetical protein